MISILIPTYNYNIYPLVKCLENLAIKAKIDFEIIAIDDGSNSNLNIENDKINLLVNSRFIAKKENVGLSQNRNNLVSLSKYKYLLFIDGDSKITNKNYINNYLVALDQNPDVIYGGRVHPNKVEPNRKLRWKYGKQHEDSKAIERRKIGYKSVLFNNTIIKKSIFETINFDKNITKYGHEDSIFAYQLSLKKAKVLHIDNSVLHNDVDMNEVFFRKTQRALENLNYIYKNEIIENEFITFLSFFSKISASRINYLFAIGYKIFNALFRLNLTSNNPSLFIFNIFRISYFCHINLKK